MIISEILWRHSDYVGCKWRHSGSLNDYSTLEWFDNNTIPKPTLEKLEQDWPLIKQQMIGEKLRKKRDELLVASDFMVLPDRTATTEQLTYRQALRDLPSNSPNADLDEYGTLINVTWPTKP